MAWRPEQAEALLRQAGIDPQRRAETLSLEEWAALTYAHAARAEGSSPDQQNNTRQKAQACADQQCRLHTQRVTNNGPESEPTRMPRLSARLCSAMPAER